MAEGTPEVEEVDEVDALLEGTGAAVHHDDDPGTLAVDLAELLDAELARDEDEFGAAIERRRQLLAERVAAHAALDLHDRAARADAAPRHQVIDLETLGELPGRVARAGQLLEASRDQVQERAATDTGLAVHPDSIRHAAADVTDARAAVADARGRLEHAADDQQAPSTAEDPPASGLSPLPRPSVEARRRPPWEGDEGPAFIQAVAAAGIALVVAIGLLVVAGNALGFVLPLLAAGWVAVVVVRQREGAIDSEIASQHLANVTSLTDLAYGGAAAGPLDEVDAAPRVVDAAADPTSEARHQLALAEDRLRYAESAWRSLVGPDADVDDLEGVLRARDAQHGVAPGAVDLVPSVRAAAAHGRRLRAQWKLAWWALDRPIPPPEEAESALTALAAEGTTAITIPTHEARQAFDDADRQRLTDLGQGRSLDELRERAEATVVPLIVDGRAVAEDEFRTQVSALSEDVRVVLIAPRATASSGGANEA